MERRFRGIEWPTLAMLAGCHAVWLSAGLWLWPVAPVLALAVMTVMVTLHSSLQHEVLHGHPTRNRHLNEALVFLPIGLFFPYRRFKTTHLQHHHDERLTDPFDDPESRYMALGIWQRLPAWLKSVMVFNNTLLGRLTIGPLVSVVAFLSHDIRHAATDGKIRLAWLLHFAGMVPVLLIVHFAFGIPFWIYLMVPAYFGLSLLLIRTFCEHQWAEAPEGRTIIVERSILSVLFLFNNLHIVHHSLPAVPWYKLPALYRERRAEWQAINQGYVYPSYWAIFKAHFFSPKEPVPHPVWHRGEIDEASSSEAKQTVRVA